jgi:hypothetical protein
VVHDDEDDGEGTESVETVRSRSGLIQWKGNLGETEIP